ncbi:MAG: ABC transporter substrate-binding protein [Chloroflexota bacterium]
MNRIDLAFGRTLTLLLVLAIVSIACTSESAQEPSASDVTTTSTAYDEVILTLGGWRTATGHMNQLLAEFHREYPHITVRFDPSDSAEYDSILEAQLEAGTAPDVFYVRSYSSSEALFQEGHLISLSGLPGLEEQFSPAVLAAWSTDDGVPYAVPFSATSHGVYYNQDLFQDLGLGVPGTWDEFLVTADRLDEAGVIPLANGTKVGWALAETIFMNLAPGFIGGREGRQAYLSGERCFNDESMVSAFQAVQDLAPFLPQDHHLLGYIDSLQLFAQGKAAMWLSGSWDIPYFEEAEPNFAWSVFAVPPPASRRGCVTFHPDVGIGLNASSTRQDEARAFLNWMTRPEFGRLLGSEMPGFFPMHRESLVLENDHANAFLALNQGRDTDIRFVWEALREGSPSGYALVQQGTKDVLLGKQSPQEAADALQEGLAAWFEPAQICED